MLCLPNAGGGATVYHSWAGKLPEGTELLAVRYPGRQERLAEPPMHSVAELVEGMYAELGPFLDLPLVLFGHSVGASIAHELALRLEREHDDVPALLVVSAGRGPGRGLPPEQADVTDEELINAITTLGGAQASAYEDPEMRALLLPMLRADYTVRATYEPSVKQVRCPVISYVGDADPGCSVPEARSWSQVAYSKFTCEVFPGGHFYLVPQQDAVLANLTPHLVALSW
jgi:pyochelin biosynthetic protein PchC